MQKYERILCSAHCKNVATFIGLAQNSFTGEDPFFKCSLAGKAKDVLGYVLIDYFGDEGTVELEFNCLITFIKVNNENY